MTSMERIHPRPPDDAEPERIVITAWSGYTVPELRQLAHDHGITVSSRAIKDEIVAALKNAGVTVEHKPLERYRYHRRKRFGQ
jgi:hypothetical protein